MRIVDVQVREVQGDWSQVWLAEVNVDVIIGLVLDVISDTEENVGWIT